MSLWLQEFFFTLFAARERVFLQWGREDSFSKTPRNAPRHLKGLEWLRTMDYLLVQKKGGRMGSDLDCHSGVCRRVHSHMRECVEQECMSVHPGPYLLTTVLGRVEVQSPVLD